MAPQSGAGEAVDVEEVVVEVADAIVKRRPTVGTLLAGRFRIVRFLGHGGHAMVFVAQHVVTHKCYAGAPFFTKTIEFSDQRRALTTRPVLRPWQPRCSNKKPKRARAAAPVAARCAPRTHATGDAA